MLHIKPTQVAIATIGFIIVTNNANAQNKLSSFFNSNFFQKTNFSIGIGFANYGGDLQQKRFTLQQAAVAKNVGLSYYLNDYLRLKADYTYAEIGADDKQNTNPILQSRNLNFKAKLSEVAITMQYDFIDEKKYGLVPYGYAGIAYFKASPYSIAQDGTKYFLAGLHTEGQNLNKPLAYSTKHLSIPFGVGLRMRLDDVISVSYELGFRKTFTDYMDDVSTTYANYTTLYNYNPITAQLAYRGGEIKTNDVYPTTGTQRGNANKKDYYYFGLLKLNVNFAGLTKSQPINCPKKVL